MTDTRHIPGASGLPFSPDWITRPLFGVLLAALIIAADFKGPADLCAYPNAKGLMVVVPDLVKGELRFVQLGK